MKLTEAQQSLLTDLAETDRRGAFCRACDGKDRAIAHELEKRGLADWKGSNWGSQHWAITDAGRALKQSQSQEPAFPNTAFKTRKSAAQAALEKDARS